MPHYFTTRTRMFDTVKNGQGIWTGFRWEILNASVHVLGGIIFIFGSIFFFPRFSELSDWGAALFFVGSAFYLLVTGHDWIELKRHLRKIAKQPARRGAYERVAVYAYFIATVTFVFGSLLFLSCIDMKKTGAWMFVLGSLGFASGAAINVLQIHHTSRVMAMRLMNLTALCFLAGSVLFAVASLPYLWDFRNEADKNMVYAFMAWQYLVGSVLFFMGGVFSGWRVVAKIRDSGAL